jgi:hypothetical protein
LDANVLVALFVSDAHSRTADAWIDSDPGSLFVSDFAKVEVSAVISRQLRAKLTSESVARDALADFDEWTNRMTQPLETNSHDVRFADRLVRDFATKLAAPDALHLAMTLKHGLQLVTFDERLAEAARRSGAAVVVPG